MTLVDASPPAGAGGAAGLAPAAPLPPAAGPASNDPSHPTSLRERKKRATRAALRRAAVQLVGSRGVAAVTVEDIAARAGVSPRTFFNYFASKEEAVCGWDPSLVAEIVARLRERPAGEPPAAALRAALVDAILPTGTDHVELLERLHVVRADPHLLSHHVSSWSATERQLVATLAERRGTDPAHDRYVVLVVAATLTACRAAMLAWCDGGGRVPMADELAYHFDLLAAGLAEPKAAR